GPRPAPVPGEGGRAARPRLAGVADVRRRLRGREADGARVDGLAHDGPHARDLVRGCRALGRVLAHAVVARRWTAARYWGNVSKGQASPSPASRASRLMPSTFSSVRTMSPRWSGRVGATPKPQLPITTVVTPCHGEIGSIRSHITCAS